MRHSLLTLRQSCQGIRLTSHVYLSLFSSILIFQSYHHIYSRISEAVFISSLTPSARDHKDIFRQTSFTQFIPLSQHPTARAIPCEYTSQNPPLHLQHSSPAHPQTTPARSPDRQTIDLQPFLFSSRPRSSVSSPDLQWRIFCTLPGLRVFIYSGS